MPRLPQPPSQSRPQRDDQRPLKPAIAYTRVSTKKQSVDGYGHEFQTVTIKAFALRQHYKILAAFSDDETGMGETSIADRKGVADAMQLSREKDWPILVDEFSRFSRNTRTFENLVVRRHLKLVSCRLGVNASYAVIMSIAARVEREGELISQNTKRALQKLKEQGVLLGNRTNLDEAQRKGAASTKARALQRTRALDPVVRGLRREGRTTARAIAEGLNMKGLRTPLDKAWTVSNVRHLLKQLATLHVSQEQPRSFEDPDWGTW